MADHDWLRHLAEARFVRGSWEQGDPEAVRGLVAARVDDAVRMLHEEAKEACEIFNQHARGKRQASVLPITVRGNEAGGGIMLLMARCQLKLALVPSVGPGVLEAQLTTIRGFERVTRTIHRFLPHVDPFGSVAWSADGGDNALLMTHELIIKRLFEDIARAGFESGEET